MKVIDEYTDKMSVHRFALKTRRMKKNLLMQLVKYIEFSFRIFSKESIPIGNFKCSVNDVTSPFAMLLQDTEESELKILTCEQQYKILCC